MVDHNPNQPPRVEQAVRCIEANSETKMGIRLTYDESVAMMHYIAKLQKQADGARGAFRAGVEWSARYLDNDGLGGVASVMRGDAAQLLTDEQIDKLRKELSP